MTKHDFIFHLSIEEKRKLPSTFIFGRQYLKRNLLIYNDIQIDYLIKSNSLYFTKGHN